MKINIISDVRCFSGRQIQASHDSVCCSCSMEFSIFLPPQAEKSPVPVLYWLSGLTCTDQNFVTKAGAQQYAAEHGIAIVCPDTSPRGEGVADDPEGNYDLGLGAGFYVNATQAPWSAHYRMYDYVSSELPKLVNQNFAVNPEKISISGHSMGGHGALTIALNNPQMYKSASAFAPIVAPSQVPWGNKALTAYLGSDQRHWLKHDTVELVKVAVQHLPILVDQGEGDNFLAEQLKTELLVNAATDCNYPMEIRLQEGYDHSYFFIASFIGEHIAFHASRLKG